MLGSISPICSATNLMPRQSETKILVPHKVV